MIFARAAILFATNIAFLSLAYISLHILCVICVHIVKFHMYFRLRKL